METWYYRKHVLTGSAVMVVWEDGDIVYVGQRASDTWPMETFYAVPSVCKTWDDNLKDTFDVDSLLDNTILESGGFAESWFPGFPLGYPAGRYWKVYHYVR